jgi:peptide/nickel transport system permease protein
VLSWIRARWFAVALFLVVALLILAGPLIAPYDPSALGTGPQLTGPSIHHFFGTDQYGRDVWSRILHGGTGVILIPLAGTAGAFLIGGVGGVVAGYAGGWLDAVFGRVTDVLLALPALLLVLLVIAGAGRSSAVTVLALIIVFAPRFARVARGAAQVAAANDYVDVARLRGEPSIVIGVVEVLPNIRGTLMVEFAIRMTQAIIFTATLNFLGVGAQPPSSDWGLMVAEGRSIVSIQPWAALGPALFIALLCISLNLLADSVGASARSTQGERELGGAT